MNKTKKITEGAILLAILIAFMYLNIRLGNLLGDILVLVIPIIIIIYATKYTFNDGLILSITILIINFILGTLFYDLLNLIYFPIGIIVGLGYSFGIKRNYDKRTLSFISIIFFVLGELVVICLLGPLLNIDLVLTYDEIKKYTLELINNANMYYILGDIIDNIVIFSYFFTIIILGILEGIIIHIFSIYILSRLKIKELGQISLYDLKPNKILSYICMVLIISLFMINKLNNETITLFIIGLAIFGFIILIYYGYIFILLYGYIVLKRNLSFYLIFIILLFMPTLFIIMILGFLYGSGPLREYIVHKKEKL